MAALRQYRHNLSLSFICRQSCGVSDSPKIPLSYSKQPDGNGKKHCSQPMETTGCQRGHSSGRYLWIFVDSGFWRVNFSGWGCGSRLFIHNVRCGRRVRECWTDIIDPIYVKKMLFWDKSHHDYNRSLRLLNCCSGSVAYSFSIMVLFFMYFY